VLLTIEADRTLWHSSLDKYHRTLKGEQHLEILLYLTVCGYQMYVSATQNREVNF